MLEHLLHCALAMLRTQPCLGMNGYFKEPPDHEVGINVMTLSYIGLEICQKGNQLLGYTFSQSQVVTLL